MAQQCAVAGHIVGVVQERSYAAANTPAAADQEDHRTTGHTAAAEIPVPIEEAVSSPLKLVQIPNTAGSRSVQVPVEQKISSQTVAVDYCNTSPSPDTRPQPPALLSGRHSDMGNEHIPGLSREAGGKLPVYHTTSNDKPAAAEIIDSCTSTATGITSSACLLYTSPSPRD